MMAVASGWKETTVSALASVSRGASPRPIASTRWFDANSGVRWVRIADVNRSDGRTLLTTTQALSPDGIARSRFLKPGTLIMSIAATVGIPVITGVPTCIHDGFVALEDLKADNRFLLYVLKASEQRLREAGQSGSQMNVNTEIVKGLSVRIPSDREEQKRLASALWDVDELITMLARNIAKKQAIKQGMMQQLLTGKTRLPSFTEPWRETALGELARVDPEALGSGTDPQEFIDYVSLEDVDRGEIVGHSRLRFGEAPSRARRVVRDMDVLFGTVRPNLQSHAIYRGGFRHPIASTGFAVVRAVPGAADSRFLFYLLMSHLTTMQIDRIIAGSNYPAVSSGDVRRLSFDFPGRDEQSAIGSVLADCDDALTLLKDRLNKARAVKQGMMQELLTGRTRLPVQEASS